jgi:hypothetical protein
MPFYRRFRMGAGHPFSVFKRGGRPCYVVQFKNEAGEFLPARSTGQETKAAAIETAYRWMREGIPQKNGVVSAEAYKILDAIRKTDFTKAEGEKIASELRRKGILKSYVLTESREAVDFGDFLTNFWTWETSPYIAEKLRKKHSIHRLHANSQLLTVQRYWLPFFSGRALGELTKADIAAFIKTARKHRGAMDRGGI